MLALIKIYIGKATKYIKRLPPVGIELATSAIAVWYSLTWVLLALFPKANWCTIKSQDKYPLTSKLSWWVQRGQHQTGIEKVSSSIPLCKPTMLTLKTLFLKSSSGFGSLASPCLIFLYLNTLYQWLPGDAVSEDDEGNANDTAKSNSTLFIFNHDVDLESLIEVNDYIKMKILMQINSF